MAYMNAQTTAASFQRADAMRDTVDALRTRFAQWKVYRTTLSELSELSGRELADLGLHRSNIRSTAYEAAYGKK